MKKGQSGDVFTMLVGSVFAMALLLVIYSVVSGFEAPLSGLEVTKSLAKQAYESKDLCFERKIVPFHKGEVISLDKLVTGVVFDIAIHSIAFEQNGNNYITKTDVNAALSAKCTSPTSCYLYFGSKNCQ